MKRHEDVMIKICGVANLEDALFAHKCGADIVGVVLDPKVRRHGDSRLVSEIHSAGIQAAGVYTSLDSVILDSGDEDYIQLHFSHGPETVKDVRRITGRKIISVIQFTTTDGLVHASREHYDAGADIVLLENREGIIGNIGEIEDIQKSVRTGVAGKITPENAGRFVQINPLMVDLSSSLETFPGKKDHKLMAELFNRLEAA